MYIYDNDFLTEEEKIRYAKEMKSAPYLFFDSIEAAKDNIVGIYGNKFSDNGIMTAGSNDWSIPDPLRDVGKEIIGKFAKKHNFEIENILRIRTNLTFRSFDRRPMDPHVDLRMKYESFTCVYFANNSDGNTNLYNERYTGKEITQDELTLYKSFKPEAGGFLMFDGDIFHSWEYPYENDFRSSMVINVQGKFKND